MTAPRRRSERGSVLLLFPAAILVVFVLGVICVDAGASYLARRSLTDHVTESADDVASQALDLGAFYGSPQTVRIDPTRAQQVVADLTALQSHDGGLEITAEQVVVSPDGRQVTVTASGRARTVFAFGPARRHVVVLHAQATATVREVRVSGSTTP